MQLRAPLYLGKHCVGGPHQPSVNLGDRGLKHVGGVADTERVIHISGRRLEEFIELVGIRREAKYGPAVDRSADRQVSVCLRIERDGDEGR